MHGHIDEEQHYQFVKKCVADSGVGYYDVFKFHFGYHSVAEAKTDMGIVNAFQRLKNEGLVKHLALSQHHYNNIGGDMAYDIVGYLIENSPYEAAQFFYTYGDKKEIEDVIALAKKNDFGTIAMKTMGGVGRAGQGRQNSGDARPTAIQRKHTRQRDGEMAHVQSEPDGCGHRHEKLRPGAGKPRAPRRRP